MNTGTRSTARRRARRLRSQYSIQHAGSSIGQVLFNVGTIGHRGEVPGDRQDPERIPQPYAGESNQKIFVDRLQGSTQGIGNDHAGRGDRCDQAVKGRVEVFRDEQCAGTDNNGYSDNRSGDVRELRSRFVTDMPNINRRSRVWSLLITAVWHATLTDQGSFL